MDEMFEDKWSIIAAQLAGEPLPGGIDFTQWLNSDSVNRQLWDEARLAWEKSAAASSIASVDVDRGWSVVSNQIVRRGKQRRLILASVSVAAAVALLAAIVVVLSLTSRRPVDTFETGTVFAGSMMQVTLDDGSSVDVNRNSGLFYPEKFVGSTRTVRLQGEAFFQVAKDTAHPFVVEFDKYKVVVKGTSFNLRHGEAGTELSVLTGVVELATVEGEGRAMLVKAGQSCRVHSLNGDFVLSDGINPNAIAWKTRRIVFSNTPFDEVCSTIESVYGVDIVDGKNIDSASYALTASFSHDDLDYVLKVISLTLNISFNKIDDFQYEVSMIN
jgi:ferric-dicitrate binding protein FerR (iron transport regulator)